MDSDTPVSFARRIKLGNLGALPDLPFNVKTLASAGVIRPIRPDKLARILRELRRWGASPAAGIATAAISHPDDPMIEDEVGSLTFADVHRRSNALARALADEGVKPGDGVAIMARNHRGFVDATLALSKLGANGLYMNTAFSSPAARRRGRARGAGGADLRRGVRRPALRRGRGSAPLRLLVREGRNAATRRPTS